MSLGVCCSIHHPSRQPRRQSHFDLHTDQRHLSPRTRKHGGGQRRMIREGGMAVVTSIAGRHCEKLRWPMTPLSMLPMSIPPPRPSLQADSPDHRCWQIHFRGPDTCRASLVFLVVLPRRVGEEVAPPRSGEVMPGRGEVLGRGGDAARWRGGQLEVRESRRGRGVGYHICL